MFGLNDIRCRHIRPKHVLEAFLREHFLNTRFYKPHYRALRSSRYLPAGSIQKEK